MKLTNNTPLKIFLCHASEDKQPVRNLYNRLSSDGFHVWLDEESLLPGQNWEEEISKNIRTADIVLVCLSKHSISKTGYINKEIKFAFDKYDEKPDGSIFIIPAKIEECEIPERFRRIQWVNLFNTDGYEKLLKSFQESGSTKSEKEFLTTTLNAKLEMGFQSESIKQDSSDIPPALYVPIQESYNDGSVSRNITITLGSTGNKERDKRRIKTVYGTLISYHGIDTFSFRIFRNGKYHLINFPNDTTRICSELVMRLHNVLNPELKMTIDSLQKEEDNQNETPF